MCVCVCTGALTVTVPLHATHPLQNADEKQCLCPHDSRTDAEVAVPTCAQEHERFCMLLYHPTLPQRSACVCATAKKKDEVAVLVCSPEQTVSSKPHPTADDYESAMPLSGRKDHEGVQVGEFFALGAQVREDAPSECNFGCASGVHCRIMMQESVQ